MSVLAADRKAITGRLDTASLDNSIVHDYSKITLNASRSLALGIAGNTQDHYYAPTITYSGGIDDIIWKIRKHMEEFLRIHDRSNLSAMTSFVVNEGIISFFDENLGMYFSIAFRFSPVHNQTRLYRANDAVQIFTAGSGSKEYETAVGIENINSFIASTKNTCTPEACISWMQDVYKKVSACDEGSGSEAEFLVSTRSNPKFHERS